MMNQSAIFGTILSAGEIKNMIVELENGERGVVTFSEVGRRNLAEDFPVQLMIGKRLGFVPGELNADALRELSARRYEDQMFDQIRADFESRTRNVYPAELVSVTPNVAYYRIAQGVNGGVTTGDFAYSFVPSFTMPGMHLPRRATAVVKQIYDTGRIDLTLRPAFGDFEQNVDRLGLEADCEFEAPVVYRAKMASSNVAMLSPNLTVLCGDAPVGGVVRMRCTNIDREAHRIYAETTEKYVRAAAVFDYERACSAPKNWAIMWTWKPSKPDCARSARRQSLSPSRWRSISAFLRTPPAPPSALKRAKRWCTSAVPSTTTRCCATSKAACWTSAIVRSAARYAICATRTCI